MDAANVPFVLGLAAEFRHPLRFRPLPRGNEKQICGSKTLVVTAVVIIQSPTARQIRALYRPAHIMLCVFRLVSLIFVLREIARQRVDKCFSKCRNEKHVLLFYCYRIQINCTFYSVRHISIFFTTPNIPGDSSLGAVNVRLLGKDNVTEPSQSPGRDHLFEEGGERLMNSITGRARTAF